MVKKAIDYFNKSLEIAARNKNIKYHVTTKEQIFLYVICFWENMTMHIM